MSSVRDKFVECFGEDQAIALEQAATYHDSEAAGIYSNTRGKGSDPFRWTLLMCIGFQYIEKAAFREWHKITASWEVLKPWIIEHAGLAKHDGDFDHLSMFAGVYDEFMKKEATHV